MFSLDPFGGYRGGSYGGAAAKGFEFGFLDVAVVVYFDLKLWWAFCIVWYMNGT